MSRSRSGTTVYCPRDARDEREHSMLDIVMLVIAAAFFALSIGYVYACERL
jgi:hypothetical protein